MPSEEIEQRVNLKFLVKLKKSSPTEYIKFLKDVYGDNLMSHSHVSEWHKRFSVGAQEWHIVSLLGDVTSPTTAIHYVSMTSDLRVLSTDKHCPVL